MLFNEKLVALRKDKGLSQEMFAEQIGVSRQAVAKWERGETFPDIKKLIIISNIYNISIDRLVKEDEDCYYKNELNEMNNSNRIIDFLCRAKRKTYAGKGIENEASRPNSHDLHYQEGDLLYIDTFIGGEKFSGEEAIWINNNPIWSMNYVGRIINEGFSGDFLKEALLLVPKEYPYRGPMMYRSGDFSYHCVIEGEFDWFIGYEEIFYINKKVYECRFHGGSIT